MERLDYAEKVQNFIATLEWEVSPANMRDTDEVMTWEAMTMGPTKRKRAARALSAACRLANVSLPEWAL